MTNLKVAAVKRDPVLGHADYDDVDDQHWETPSLMIMTKVLSSYSIHRSQLSRGIQFSDMLEATGVYRQGQGLGPRPTTYRCN